MRIKAHLPSEVTKECLKILGNDSLRLSTESQVCDLYLSQQENFSENIFWDLDALVFKILSYSSMTEQKKYTLKVLKLHERYGCKTSINFAYAHDFVYGFDWFRWVKKDYQKRSLVKPYDDIFLEYLDKRSLELYQLIEQNDKKYPILKPGVKRNPFSFKRSVNDEIQIHLKMSQNKWIPWKAWESNPKINQELW